MIGNKVTYNYCIKLTNLCKHLKNNKMNQLFLKYRTRIITHSIALVIGGVISFLIFTSTDGSKITDKQIELERHTAVSEELVKDIEPTIDFKTELEAKELELETAYQINEKLKEQLIKERNEKIRNTSNLSDDELFRFITEWAKRNGSLPQ